MNLRWSFSGGVLFSLTIHALLKSALVYAYPEIKNRDEWIWKEYPLLSTEKTPETVSSFENTEKDQDIIFADKMIFPDLVIIRKQKMPLDIGDEGLISESSRKAKLIFMEKNYFFHNLSSRLSWFRSGEK